MVNMDKFMNRVYCGDCGEFKYYEDDQYYKGRVKKSCKCKGDIKGTGVRDKGMFKKEKVKKISKIKNEKKDKKIINIDLDNRKNK